MNDEQRRWAREVTEVQLLPWPGAWKMPAMARALLGHAMLELYRRLAERIVGNEP